MGHVCVLKEKAKIAVQDDVRSQGINTTNRKAMGLSLAGTWIGTVDRTPLQRFSENRLIDREEIKDTIATEHVKFAVDVVVDLTVHRPAVKQEARLSKIVVGFARQIGRWNERKNLFDDRADAVRANNILDAVAADDRAPCAVGSARQWIVYVDVQASEIAGANQSVRDSYKQAVVLSVFGALIAGEEEELVLNDRAAQSSTILVLDELALRVLWWAEIVSGLQVLIGVIFKCSTVKIIRSALDLHIDGRAAGESLFGIEAVSHNVDCLNGFQRRDVSSDVRQPDVGRSDSINTSVVR